MLTTPTQYILVDNISPAPSSWATLQLYQPGGFFTLSQIVNADLTNAYVVQFTGDISSTVSNFDVGHSCCAAFTGSQFVQDVPATMDPNDTYDQWAASKSGAESFYLLGLPGGAQLDAIRVPQPVVNVGKGPAVNINGASQMKEIRSENNRGNKGTRLLRRLDRYGNSGQGGERFAAAH